MTRHQLTEHLRNPTDRSLRGTRLRGMNLADSDFSGLDMTGADLSFCNLRRSNFNRANLRGANLRFSNLGGSSFIDTDLRNTNLSFSGLSGANLSRANLEGASLSFTNVSRQAFDTPRPAGPITLVGLLNKPVWGVLVGSVLGALLVYGTSSIIYFSSLILTARNPVVGRLNQFIAYQNLNQGVAVFLVVWVLSAWLDRTFRPIWLRHLVLSMVLIPVCVAVSTFAYFIMGQAIVAELAKQPNLNNSDFQGNTPWYVYVGGYLLIANGLLYTLRQGRQVTRRMSEQEYQLLSLEKLKTRAELDALQARINPHFLYNALNSIASLVHESPDKAEEMTMLLSKLFRYTTGRDETLTSTVADELEMVSTYLCVEQVRFGHRLDFSIHVADPGLNALQLPPFLLQPIVENAVKHGISHRADGGTIRVDIFGADGWLNLGVSDNGPAFADAMNTGYGLRSIQERLRLLYADSARLTILNQPQKQVLIQIAMACLNTRQTHEPALKNHPH